MRVSFDESYGDPAVLQTNEGEEYAYDMRPPGTEADPSAPDLSFFDVAISSHRHGDSKPLQQALTSFFDTFDTVVNANPTNRIEPASLMRLKELTVKVKAGNLAPGDPELLKLLAAAKRNGKAVGAVYKFFLFFDPYGMFAQIRGVGLKAFQPVLGPVLVVDGDAVRDVLSRHEEFTVDPYGREMSKTMTSQRNGSDGGPGLPNFILGTDEASVYEPDKRLLTQVVNFRDPKRIRPLITEDCLRRVGSAVEAARRSGEFQLDVVKAVARFVPVTLGKVYLGVPAQNQVEHFELSADMLDYYGEDLRGGPDGKQALAGTGLKADDGIVADEATMYDWIKSAFECFFNNVSKDVVVQREGFRSCRLLLCSLLREIQQHKARLRNGARLAPLGRSPRSNQIRNTMLTRLVNLQLRGDVPEQLVTDLRIAENVMGTMVGAVAGQEEATCRVIDALLKLQEGVYKPSSVKRMRGSFLDARKQALRALSPRCSWRSRRSTRAKLFHYFRECLRLEPQGEVLLRQCKADGTQLFTVPQEPSGSALAIFAGNRPMRAGELVFAAHGSAMKSVAAADEFRLRRQEGDDTYLFHGFGRHKCLGQYISPVVIVESMIAVLGLEGLSRAGTFKLDDKHLYATELLVNFTNTGSTKVVYRPAASDRQ